jgi:PHD/YefM family antitoxin component YafN of YafNO toxin-antitoxin module
MTAAFLHGEDGMSTISSTCEQYIVDAKGRKTAILLPLKRYRELMEDLHDLAVIAERRAEEPISLEQMERRLKEDGLL